MRFLINGSIAFDVLLAHSGSFLSGIDRKNLEHLSVNYLAEGFARHHGGTAANIGWSLALLGHTPVLLSAVGTDGSEYLKLLNDRGITTHLVEERKDSVTAVAIIATDLDERQISFFHPGADGRSGLPDLSNEEDIAYAIMSPRNPILMLQGARACRALGIPYLFDPGQVVHAFSRDELRRAIADSRGLVVNEYEWGLAQKILDWSTEEVSNACSMLTITRGERGLTIITPTETLDIPACTPERTVNPTGAGDAVRAGLLHGLASQWPLLETGRLAAILGCLLVEQEGTLLETLDLEEVQRRAQEHYGKKLPTVLPSRAHFNASL